MKRKIFISILGTGDYKKCKYYIENPGEVYETCYAQLATICLLYSDWSAEDKILILTTPDAKSKHLASLVKEYKESGVAAGIDDEDIEEGFTQESLWEIFDTIVNLIPHGSELYLDVTHAFRYLPMLALVLINYAKVVKNITVGRITYGNYEARDKDRNIAPITDLTSFSELQDWAIGVNDFMCFGNTQKIKQLADKGLKPFLARSEDQDKSANYIKDAIASLDRLTDEIQTCRLKSIVEGQTASNVLSNFDKATHSHLKPLKQLIDIIRERTEQLSAKENITNGFMAVEWCLRNGMIQQGYTILQENVINYLCIKTGVDIEDRSIREEYSVELHRRAKRLNTYVFKDIKGIESISRAFAKITSLRNDINHAGMRKNPCGAGKFEKPLKESLDELIKIINADKPN